LHRLRKTKRNFEISLEIPGAYPILTVDYRKKMGGFEERLSNFNNLLTFGRQGAFTYENADILIKESIHHRLFELIERERNEKELFSLKMGRRSNGEKHE